MELSRCPPLCCALDLQCGHPLRRQRTELRHPDLPESNAYYAGSLPVFPIMGFNATTASVRINAFLPCGVNITVEGDPPGRSGCTASRYSSASTAPTGPSPRPLHISDSRPSDRAPRPILVNFHRHETAPVPGPRSSCSRTQPKLPIETKLDTFAGDKTEGGIIGFHTPTTPTLNITKKMRQGEPQLHGVSFLLACWRLLVFFVPKWHRSEATQLRVFLPVRSLHTVKPHSHGNDHAVHSG